jgi:hypothetical protein
VGNNDLRIPAIRAYIFLTGKIMGRIRIPSGFLSCVNIRANQKFGRCHTAQYQYLKYYMVIRANGHTGVLLLTTAC